LISAFISTILQIFLIKTNSFGQINISNEKPFTTFIKKTTVTESEFEQDSESAANDYISFYQKYISGIRGQACPMQPSCSNYALQAIKDRSIVSGMIMSTDRLIRCGHDHKYYESVPVGLTYKLHDEPIHNNSIRSDFDFNYSNNGNRFAYSDTLNDDSTLIYIKKLINNGYHSEALQAILYHEFSISDFNLELFINKIICLSTAGEFEKAIFDYEVRCSEEFKKNSDLAFQIALIHYKLGNYDKALFTNNISIEHCHSKFLKPKLIILNGILYANKIEWEKSKESYQKLTDFEGYERVAKSSINLTEQAIHQKNKKPFLAATLSTLLPGAGYAYTNHKQTAISALIVNGLLAYATYSSFKTGNYGMSALTGVFNLSFYISNIYGSAQSAKRYNSHQKKSLINQLEYYSNL
jgi:putative membrane protein insertion efficiency factor